MRSAAVIYDARLSDRARFVHAAGSAAALRMEAEQLEAELSASTKQLTASRLRLLEAADAERQRIERDLHDGVQQQIVGLRLKLDMASEAIKVEPARGERMLVSVGRDIDGLLATLRSLAKGIYPTILRERGLREAIGSAALSVPLPVSISARGIGRYQEETEVAVYFCCVEALQNIVKHGGPSARALVRMWQGDHWLRFEVRDTGVGFSPGDVDGGSGMVNMTDRIEAVGGRLWVDSAPGRGTSVRGRVPIQKADRAAAG
jgi:signal transduction histidine kinase